MQQDALNCEIVLALRKTKGFFLIELVLVIVIIGFLAATALPRFLAVREEATKASVEGVASNFAAAVLLVRAQWEGKGQIKQNGYNVTNYDGTTFYLTTPTDSQLNNGELAPGYPLDTIFDGTTLSPANLSALRCLNILQGLLQNPPNATADFTEVQADKDKFNYYVSVSLNGNNSICRYYLIERLRKGRDGQYQDPQGVTDNLMSFSYRPAFGQVISDIN